MRSSLLTQPRSALWWESLKLLSSSHTWTLHLLTQHTHNCWDFSCWWTHSIISVASEDVQLVITGRPAQSADVPILFLLSGPKMFFFAPQRWHVAPIKVKFGTGSGPCQISPLSGQKCGNTAPKTVIISNFCHKFAHQERLVCTFLRKSQRLYASIGSF